MARIRVLQVMAGARHGGAEAFFTRLVPALERAGLEQRVVIRRDAERAAKLREDGIEPLELSFGAFLDFKTSCALCTPPVMAISAPICPLMIPTQ